MNRSSGGVLGAKLRPSAKLLSLIKIGKKALKREHRRLIEETSAACKFQFVFCHENGTSIQPRGLSIASTARSS